MKKACLIMVVIMVFLTSFTNTNVFATGLVEVVDVKVMDVNSQINGSVVEYILDVPASWRKYIYMEKEVQSNSKTIVEKLVLYYLPTSATSSKSVFMELAVFNKSGWTTDVGYTKLSESEKYVFAYKLAVKNPYVFGSDRLIFDNMFKEASKAGFIKDYVSFPTEKDSFVKFTVSVNGKRIASQSYTNALRAVYVPVREVCQELGYSVVWNATDSTVSIYNGSFYITLGKEITSKQKYNIITIGGKSYVSTMFILQALKCSVEIDQYSNVRISRDAQQINEGY